MIFVENDFYLMGDQILCNRKLIKKSLYVNNRKQISCTLGR